MIIEERIARLSQKGSSWLLYPDENIVNQAITNNPWFTREDIHFALATLSKFLNEAELRSFLHKYNFLPQDEIRKTVGLILAGNIPAAGFHDVLMLILSGVSAKIRCSHLDSVLIPAFMKDVFPDLQNLEFTQDFTGIDALIASGSSLTAMYLKDQFAGIPMLIRSGRYSAAVLEGFESEADLKVLANDILIYNGLGCRNVSQIFVPENYKVSELGRILTERAKGRMSAPYLRKLRWEQALEDWRGNAPDFNLPVVFFRKEFPEPAEAAVVNIITYKNKSDLNEMVKTQQSLIQCVCGSGQIYSFGQLQIPEISDFADQTDTLLWLSQVLMKN